MIKLVAYLYLLFISFHLLEASQIKIPESMTQEFFLVPNEKFKHSIPLHNLSDEVARVKIYQADYLYYANGENHYLEPGTTSRSNAHWLKVYPSYLEIPPHSEVHVTYEGQVPSDLDQVGMFWSLIFIEPQQLSVQSPEHTHTLAIQTIMRYGFQIVTHLKSKAKNDLKIIEKTVVKKDDQYFLVLDAENKGQGLLDPAITVHIFDLKGRLINQVKQSKKRIYPLCSVRYEICLPPLAQGHYQALVILDSADNDLFGAQYTIDIQ